MLTPVILTIPALLLPLTMSPVRDGQSGRPGDQAADDRALVHFEAVVDEYVQMRRLLEPAWPPASFIADLGEVERRASALREAIRAARPLAAQGDIFTPELADVLRVRLSIALGEQHVDLLAMSWPVDDDVSEIPWKPAVHDTLPWNVFGATWPVFRMLPTLPLGLEYRLIGRTLVLLDVGAHLVVDTLDLTVPASGRAAGAEKEERAPVDDDFTGCGMDVRDE